MVRIKSVVLLGIGVSLAIALLSQPIAYYIGFEEGGRRLAEKCYEDQQAAYDETLKLCDCEITSGNRRWRYGLCVTEYIDPLEAEIIAVVKLSSVLKSSPRFGQNITKLQVQDVISQKMNKEIETGDIINISFPETSQEIGWFRLLQSARGRNIDRAVFFLTPKNSDTASSIYVVERYYTIYGDASSANVRPGKNDIQMYHADDGASYVQHHSEVPLGDFLFSLQHVMVAK